MFTLTDTQRLALADARAWQAEGERRFDYWSRRAALQDSTAAFAQALAASGLRHGQTLAPETRALLLSLAASLAPNSTLSRRLYASGPAAFDRRLRELLLGTASLEERVRQFVAVPGAGAFTAAQLLCASAPDMFPLITRAALRRLHLSAVQKRDALADAAAHYGFALPETPDPAQSLLALFVVYDHVRRALGLISFPEVDDLLKETPPPSPETPPSQNVSVVREDNAAYDTAPMLTETVLLAALEEYAVAQGFAFPPHLLRAYYVSLQTKPFAILSGVSGSGKTKMAELFAEALTGHNPAQFRLLPVRPDWADSSPLLGYQNVLANRYVSTPFLDMAREAARPENRDRAYFVCLDEMNLARVEHYLADYLSVLESRARRIPLQEGVPDFVLPANFFVTGTVNVDETTHGFSRKVLDRANTLDFDTDAPPLAFSAGGGKGAGLALGDNLRLPADCQRLFLGSRIVGVGRARERLSQIDARFPERALSALQSVNDLLHPQRLHFAFRVRDDVLVFLANAFDAQTHQGLILPDPEENFALALDLQLCQKVLPRLAGLADALAPLLSDLQAWAEAWPLPRTASRLARMRVHGAQTGYVRFHE